MKYLRYAALIALLAMPLAFAQAAVVVRAGVGVGVGPYVAGPPVCDYGYYPDYPYTCAPYGYYGPDYFVNGVFIGAGPWFHSGWGHGYYGNRYYGRAYDRGYAGRGYEGRSFAGRGYAGQGYAGRGYEGRGAVVGHGFEGRGAVASNRGGFHGGGGSRGGRR